MIRVLATKEADEAGRLPTAEEFAEDDDFAASDPTGELRAQGLKRQAAWLGQRRRTAASTGAE